MKYKVAVCDDEIATCEEICAFIASVFRELSIFSEIDVFYSCETIINHMQRGESYNFIFLDIDFGTDNTNGIEVSRFIREYKKDSSCQIIFISSKTSYAMDLFCFQPLDFLVKPIGRDKIKSTITKGLSLIGGIQADFDCIIGNDLIRTPLSQILYFESIGRKIKMIKPNEELVFYSRLTKIAKQLPCSFIQVHKSYIVNINAIRKCNYDIITIYGGLQIPIGRTYRSLVREILFNGLKGQE